MSALTHKTLAFKQNQSCSQLRLSSSELKTSTSELGTSTFLLETLTFSLQALTFSLQKLSSEPETSSKLLQFPSSELQLSSSEVKWSGFRLNRCLSTLRLSGFAGKPLPHLTHYCIHSTHISTRLGVVIHLQRRCIRLTAHRQAGIIQQFL